MLYTDDNDIVVDDTRNAVKTVSRDNRGQSTLRPVSLRPVGVSRQQTFAQPVQPAFAQPAFAQPTYAQPVQSHYLQPGYSGYPGYPGYVDPRQQPVGWVGPNGQVFYGSPCNTNPWGANPWTTSSSSADTVASAIASVFEVGASLLSAFKPLPVAPNSEEATVLANGIDYQRQLAEHAKGDERTRVMGQTAGKALGFAYKLFANRPSNAFMAPRWF